MVLVQVGNGAGYDSTGTCTGAGGYCQWVILTGRSTGYAGSAGPGKTLLPSLVIDASVGTEHMFGSESLKASKPPLREEICSSKNSFPFTFLVSDRQFHRQKE